MEELDAYYSDYRSNEWEYLVETQEGQSIEVIDHGTLQFSEEIKDSGYYIVYSWGSGAKTKKELKKINRFWALEGVHKTLFYKEKKSSISHKTSQGKHIVPHSRRHLHDSEGPSIPHSQ